MAPGTAALSGPLGGISELLDPRRKWYNNRRLIVLHAWIFLLLITSSTNGYDGSMMNGLQSLPQWQSDFHDPTNSRLGLLNAIQNIGGLAGQPFIPFAADILGRRRSVLIGALLMVVGAAVQTASQNVSTFIGARFLIGFGNSFASNAAPMLVAELSYPLYRGPLTATYNALWPSGAVIAAWTTFGTFKLQSSWAWRLPSLFQALPSMAQVIFMFFCPESPRWLINKGRDADALNILAYYHADGNIDDPLVQFEFQEIKAAIDMDKRTAVNVGWKSLFSTPGNRKRLRILCGLAFFSQWSGNGLVSYYLNKVLTQLGITNPTTQLLINGILHIWGLFWALLGAGVSDRVGRRPLFLISTAGMLITHSCQTVGFGVFAHNTSNANAAHTAIAFIFIFSAFYDIAYSPLIVSYAVEIMPYHLRAKGLTLFNLCVQVALIFNQYINPIALGKLKWKYYIVYDCWLIFELGFMFLYMVETRGKTLEETAAIFDGDQHVEQIEKAAAAAAGTRLGGTMIDADIKQDDDEKVE